MAKLWEAILDDVTCDYCEAMHGTVIRDDQQWEVPPGDVHDHCRCIEIHIMDSVAAKIDPGYATRPGPVYHPPEKIKDTPMPLYPRKPAEIGTVGSEAWILGLLLLAQDEDEDEPRREPWLHSQASTYSDWLVWD